MTRETRLNGGNAAIGSVMAKRIAVPKKKYGYQTVDVYQTVVNLNKKLVLMHAIIILTPRQHRCAETRP